MPKRKAVNRPDDGNSGDERPVRTRSDKRVKTEEELSTKPSSTKDRARRKKMTDAELAADKARKAANQRFSRMFKNHFESQEFQNLKHEVQVQVRKEKRRQFDLYEAKQKLEERGPTKFFIPEGSLTDAQDHHYGTPAQEADWNDWNWEDSDIDENDPRDEKELDFVRNKNAQFIPDDPDRAWALGMMQHVDMMQDDSKRRSGFYRIIPAGELPIELTDGRVFAGSWDETSRVEGRYSLWNTVFVGWHNAIKSLFEKINALEEVGNIKFHETSMKDVLAIFEKYPWLRTGRVQHALDNGRVPMPHHLFNSAERKVLANIIEWDNTILPMPGPTWFWPTNSPGLKYNCNEYYQRWGFIYRHVTKTRQQQKELFELFVKFENIAATDELGLWQIFKNVDVPPPQQVIARCLPTESDKRPFEMGQGDDAGEMELYLGRCDRAVIDLVDELRAKGVDLEREWDDRKPSEQLAPRLAPKPRRKRIFKATTLKVRVSK